jgi:hypothetical protein
LDSQRHSVFQPAAHVAPGKVDDNRLIKEGTHVVFPELAALALLEKV